MEAARREFEESGRRIFFCDFFDPRRSAEDLEILDTAAGWSGFKVIKIQPSFNKASADDPDTKPSGGSRQSGLADRSPHLERFQLQPGAGAFDPG